MTQIITSFLAAVIASLGIGTTQYVSPTGPTIFENTSRSHATYMVNNERFLTKIIYKDGTVLELQGENDPDELSALGVETNVIPQPQTLQQPNEAGYETVYTSVSAAGDDAYAVQSSPMTITYTIPAYYTIPAN